MSCKICGGDELERIKIENLPKSAQGFKDEPIEDGLTTGTLVLCKTCNHIQLECDAPDYYKTVIRSSSISEEMGIFRRRQFNKIKELGNYKKVLEIGSGDGCYLRLLEECFDNALGTEAGCKENEDNIIKTHPDDSDFQNKMTPYGKFDVIFCFSYLEHLPEPKRTLSKVLELLNDDGRLVIEVPNTNYILNKGLLNEVIPDHQHYFTTDSLIKLSQELGLKVVSIENVWYNYITRLEVKRTNHLKDFKGLKIKYEKFKKDLDNALLPKKDIDYVLWGAGHQALYTITSTNLIETIDWVVDSSPKKQMKYIEGTKHRIYGVDTIRKMRKNSKLIICCGGYNHEVIKQAVKLNQEISIYEIQECRIKKIK